MRNITINLPDSYVKLLEIITTKQNKSRSEIIRIALKELLERDFYLYSTIARLVPEIGAERQKNLELKRLKEQKLKKIIDQKKEKEFYNYCIVCENRLHPPYVPLNYKGLNIIKLRFCCSCFEKYKGRNLEELPEFVLKKIQGKVTRYKKQIKEKREDKY